MWCLNAAWTIIGISKEIETWFLQPFTRACLLTTLTFRALHGNHTVLVTHVVYPRLFWTTLTFRADVATIIRVMVSPVVHRRLSWISHHFDMQSTVREIALSWTVLPFPRACFQPLWLSEHRKRITLCQYHLRPSKKTKNAFFYIFCISRTPWNNSKLNSRVDDNRKIAETSEKLAKSLSGPLVKLSN